MPFTDAMRRSIHFVRHGHEFGAADEFEYERLADAFMSQAVSPVLQQCFRTTGGRVRFHFMSYHFGVARGQPESVRTFYVVPVAKVNGRGGVAGFFQSECQRNDD